MENKQLGQADWGNSTNEQSFQTKTLHIAKENRAIYLIVAWTLAITALLSVIGIILLSAFSREIPSALVALGSVTIGALGSLFTHSK